VRGVEPASAPLMFGPTAGNPRRARQSPPADGVALVADVSRSMRGALTGVVRVVRGPFSP